MFADIRLASKLQELSSVLSKLNGLTDINQIREGFNALQMAMDELGFKHEAIEENLDTELPYQLRRYDEVAFFTSGS